MNKIELKLEFWIRRLGMKNLWMNVLRLKYLQILKYIIAVYK